MKPAWFAKAWHGRGSCNAARHGGASSLVAIAFARFLSKYLHIFGRLYRNVISVIQSMRGTIHCFRKRRS
jgi:hypothetical protein